MQTERLCHAPCSSGQAHLGERILPAPPHGLHTLEHGPVIEAEPGEVVVQSLDRHRLRALRGPRARGERPVQLPRGGAPGGRALSLGGEHAAGVTRPPLLRRQALVRGALRAREDCRPLGSRLVRLADRDLQLHSAPSRPAPAALRATAPRSTSHPTRPPRAARAPRTPCPAAAPCPRARGRRATGWRSQRDAAREQPAVARRPARPRRPAAGARTDAWPDRRDIARAAPPDSAASSARRWKAYVGSRTLLALVALNSAAQSTSTPRTHSLGQRAQEALRAALVAAQRARAPRQPSARHPRAASSTVSWTPTVNTGCGLTSTNVLLPALQQRLRRLLELHGLAQVAIPVLRVQLRAYRAGHPSRSSRTAPRPDAARSAQPSSSSSRISSTCAECAA